MITMGLGELVSAAALMFMGFFGGEGGIAIDRVMGTSLLGVRYTSPWQVYCLVLAWAFIAAALMRLQTQTPLGSIANAARDNFERAQFVGYDPRVVRLYQFALSGFFAGIAGGLYVLIYEIVTFDTVSAAKVRQCAARRLYRRRRRVLRTDPRHHRGGAAAERGQPAQQRLAALCRRALHRDGDVRAGRPDRADLHACADLARRAACANWRCPTRGHFRRRCWSCWVSCCMVELASFTTIGAAQGKKFSIAGRIIDTTAPLPWVVAIAALVLGGLLAAPRGAQLPRALGRAGGRRQGPGRHQDTGRKGAGGDVVSTDVAGVPAVELRDVCKRFGATEIIRGVNLSIPRGERHAIIGPNGAGKTTLFNLISGRFPISSGSITVNGQSIAGLAPQEINRLGLSRSFQITSIFPRMTRVREHPLRPVVVARLPLLVLAPAGPAEGAERGCRAIARTAETFGPAKSSGRPAVLCRSSARWRSASPSPAAPRSSCSMSRPPA